jgi:predicted secreted hydrolase
VHGLGWLDHQWGNFATDPGALRWNWFACQLRDGRDLMLYEFLDASGRPTRYRAASFVSRTGRVSHPVRFTVSERGPFVRPMGAATTYPLGWRLEVPGAGLRLTIRARARHQYIHNTLVPSFWEGAAEVIAGPAGGCIVESSREVTATAP